MHFVISTLSLFTQGEQLVDGLASTPGAGRVGWGRQWCSWSLYAAATSTKGRVLLGYSGIGLPRIDGIRVVLGAVPCSE